MSDKLLGVQYLRAIAAIAVLLFHVSERFGGVFKVGAAGVDVFFAVSGFVMYLTTAGRPVSPKQFIERRLLRIAPLYWIATFALALAVAAKPNFFPGETLDVRQVSLSLLFIPVNASGELAPLLTQGWTLTYELYFYALFALTLSAPDRWRAPGLVGLICLLVAADAFLRPDAPLSILTAPIMLEFAAGVVLGALYRSGRLPGGRVGLLLIIVALGAFALGYDVAPNNRALAWGLPSTLLLAGVLSLDAAGATPRSPAMLYLGDASYSIYLWHTLAIVVIDAVLLRLGFASPVRMLVAAPAGLAVSTALYTLVERPLTANLAIRRSRAAPAPSV